MSDFGYQEDPYQDMGEGDMMAMYAQMNPQLYGNTPAQRLNYFQDLMSTLGTDLVQTAGVTNPAAEQYVEPMNQTGAIYGSDPFYASIFQAIEEGKDPITAARLAKDQIGFNGTQDEFNQQVVSVATDYAGERVKNQQSRSQWEAENAGGYTMPDGSKYKQTPLGGNNIRATASEYDLLGAPDVDQLMADYALSKNPAPSNAAPGKDPRYGTKGPGKDPRWGTKGDMIPSLPFGGGNAAPLTKMGGGAAPQQAAPQLAGGDYFANRTARDSINKRVEQSKGTRVRSDANNSVMRRITALAGLLQGGFPQ